MPSTLRAGHRIPFSLTSFVGRAAELDIVGRLVRENRLVTLSGAGGVGKSRLAAQLAGRVIGDYADGVWWIDLAPLTDPALVAVQAARLLGVPDQPGQTAARTLSRALGDRHMLVVLDNCEHLLEACAALAVEMLGACRQLTILATSRVPLGVAGEVAWRTPSLSLADEAIELFVERARLVRPNFTRTADNGGAVAAICRRLDGVPLAIELAAARMQAMSATEIAAGLHRRFDLLTGRTRGTLPRHQTLRASVDWSHALLSPGEQIVLRRLAVFSGGFDSGAAAAVVDDCHHPEVRSASHLPRLVETSLVHVDDADDEEAGVRYRLLETVHAYARDKLVDAGEAAAIGDRHCQHYLAVADAAGAGAVKDWIERARRDLDNFRAAFAWSRDHGAVRDALRLASLLQPLWLRGRVLEGLAWFDVATTSGDAVPPEVRARALADTLMLNHLAGRVASIVEADDAVAIARTLGDRELLARTLAASGLARCYLPEMALPVFAEAIELAGGDGNDWLLSQIFGWRAYSLFLAGDLDGARASAEAGGALAGIVGDGLVSRLCRWCLGLVSWIRADLGDAAALGAQVAEDACAAHDPMFHSCGLMLVAVALAHCGECEAASAAARTAIDVAADLPVFQQAAAYGALTDAALAAGDLGAATTAGETAWLRCPLPELLATNGNPIGKLAWARGDHAAALQSADAAIAVARGAHLVTLLATRIRVEVALCRADSAVDDCRQALTVAARTGAYLAVPEVIECLAALLTTAGQARAAVRLCGAADALRRHTGEVRFAVFDRDHADVVETLRAAVGRRDFAEIHAAGAALSGDAAIAEARLACDAVVDAWDSLTRAERGIAQLVGQGLSNKEIAAHLVVSPRTVQTHLTHIYGKLGLTSRVQLVTEVGRRS